jgi:aspartyl/asparaginyl beta-hydroxylase (cupin superfamily)
VASERTWLGPRTAHATGSSLRERAVGKATAAGTRILHWLDRYYRRHSLVGHSRFFDTALFPWTADIEAQWAVMRGELDGLLRDPEALPTFQQIATYESHMSRDEGWKTYFFFGYGHRISHTPERCPKSAELISRIPGMTTALFSFLAPGKRLPPHRGPYSGVLRYHLALKIPEPIERCGLRVGGEVRHWQEGQSLVFDDVFEHEAWNDTDEVRVVLFLDFKRPLRGFARLLNDVLIGVVGVSPYIRDARARHREWEARLERLRARSD